MVKDYENVEETPYDDRLQDCILALNNLLTTYEVCMDDKAINKVNKFKRWLLAYVPVADKSLIN